MSVNIENTTNVLNLLRAECCFGNLEKLSDDTNHGGHVTLVPDNYINCHHVTAPSKPLTYFPFFFRASSCGSNSRNFFHFASEVCFR